MTGISDRFKENLKNTVDIVDVISDYVQLKQSGKNFKGLCPFHQEKTPSFNVNPDRQFYYCFGCGAGGDVFNFLMDIENITFQESLKILARRVGMVIPEETALDRKHITEREKLFEINQLAARFYHYLLMKKDVAVTAVQYLSQRGFTIDDMKEYRLGYAPEGWRSLLNFLTERGYSQKELVKSGLVLPGKNNSFYDRFRGRVIFPIFNLRGEVLAFGGRIINNKNKNQQGFTPKYLNSPDTLIYKKGENLYGLNWARNEMRQADEAVMMEGYTDVLSAHRSGINTAVASLGTALTAEQARLLKRYVSTVYISYDADTAGARATLRGLDILKNEGLNVRVIKLPEGTDPDEYIKSEGTDLFLNLKKRALTLMDFKIEQLVKQFDLSKTDEKVKLTRALINLLVETKDRIERELYLQRIAERFQFDPEIIKKELNRSIYNKDGKIRDKNFGNRYTKKDNETKPNNNINKIEKLLIKIYIDNPEYSGVIDNYLIPEFFSEDTREMVDILRNNKDMGINQLLDKIKDNTLKSKFYEITIAQTKKANKEKVEKILTKFIFYLKHNIYIELQQGNLPLERLNELFIRFKQLSCSQGKEVY